MIEEDAKESSLHRGFEIGVRKVCGISANLAPRGLALICSHYVAIETSQQQSRRPLGDARTVHADVTCIDARFAARTLGLAFPYEMLDEVRRLTGRMCGSR